jgi:hypothetical protein
VSFDRESKEGSLNSLEQSAAHTTLGIPFARRVVVGRGVLQTWSQSVVVDQEERGEIRRLVQMDLWTTRTPLFPGRAEAAVSLDWAIRREERRSAGVPWLQVIGRATREQW